MTAIAPVVEATGVSKWFYRRRALEQVTLTVGEGSIHALVGANGAGKSTLLRLLVGVMRPDEGTVSVFGQALPREAATVRQRVHYVGADGEVFPTFRVRDLCEFISLLYERYDAQRMRRLLEVLELPLQVKVRHLSAGTKMQLRLAVALAVRPDLLVLDEPTGGLDPVVKRQFYQLLMQEAAGGHTSVLMATHQVTELERLVDTVSVLYQGRMIISQSVEDLRSRFSRLQVVARQGLPASVRNHPALLELVSTGQVHTLLVDREAGDLTNSLWDAETEATEALELGLEDAVSAVLRAQGYTRDGSLVL
ncbi:MAG: ABC transporter ATP-binding protein [Gammaproteobacteria bacterium]|nr:ABC transporter ATP-binding protein [Gammaproteobacteria bacterium]